MPSSCVHSSLPKKKKKELKEQKVQKTREKGGTQCTSQLNVKRETSETLHPSRVNIRFIIRTLVLRNRDTNRDKWYNENYKELSDKIVIQHGRKPSRSHDQGYDRSPPH